MNNKINIKQLLTRKKDTHKGDYGHLLIVAGSLRMSGAAVLCGRAALRTGAGLVTIAVPESIHAIVDSQVPEAMTLPLPETSSGSMSEKALHPLLQFLKNKKINSIVLGPGMGIDIDSRMVVIGLLNNISCSGIIDADGLNQLKGNLTILKNSSGNWIITPHPGELSRLTGTTIEEIQKNRKSFARIAAHKSGNVCVLKGYKTVVTDGKKTFINSSGNPGMATAGSGDALSGIIGGLLTQGMNTYESARWGVAVHGMAGDYAAKDKGEMSLIAGDIIDHISTVLKKQSKNK